MKIYTKTGDKGMTKLVDGSCVEKFNPRVEAYGCVDELNSQIGVILSQLHQASPHHPQLSEHLEVIQNHLFSVGSLLATADEAVFAKMPQITNKHIEMLEKWIDLYTLPLPPLKNFILPGGTLPAALLHVARTACRRAERRTSELHADFSFYSPVLIYLNRLSDLFFTQARWVNVQSKYPETIWKKDV